MKGFCTLAKPSTACFGSSLTTASYGGWTQLTSLRTGKSHCGDDAGLPSAGRHDGHCWGMDGPNGLRRIVRQLVLERDRRRADGRLNGNSHIRRDSGIVGLNRTGSRRALRARADSPRLPVDRRASLPPRTFGWPRPKRGFQVWLRRPSRTQTAGASRTVRQGKGGATSFAKREQTQEAPEQIQGDAQWAQPSGNAQRLPLRRNAKPGRNGAFVESA